MGTREEIAQIRERADIINIVSRYVNLRQSGKNYVALCPFHPDKKPSFTVSPEKNLFHCFGCGEGGDVFKFLMKIERLDFSEAVAKLASELNIKLHTESPSRVDKLRGLNKRACEYFQRNLGSSQGRSAKEYLRGRGFSEETISRFKLGYAPPGWDGLLKTLAGEEKTLETLGLVLRAKEGGYYDRFRDRIIFTIFSLSGEIAGFAGRALNDTQPTYLNISNTPLFEKSSILYGLNFARSAAAAGGSAAGSKQPQQGFIILVEGYTDVLMCHQAGIKNTVASMGTSLTENQARLLKRFTEKVIIAYDRDAAGKAASLRSMRCLRNAGLDVAVALLPLEQDPDSLIRSRGAEAFSQLIREAVPFHTFYINCLLEVYAKESVVGQEAILRETANFIKGIESLPQRRQLIRGLAEALNLPEEEIELALWHGPSKSIIEETHVNGSDGWGPEEHILYFLLSGELPVSRAMEEVCVENFSKYPDIMKAIADVYSEEGRLTPQSLLERLSPQDANIITRLALTQRRFSDTPKAVADALAQLNYRRAQRLIEHLKSSIKRAELIKDHEELVRLQRIYTQEIRKRELLKRGRG